MLRQDEFTSESDEDINKFCISNSHIRIIVIDLKPRV